MGRVAKAYTDDTERLPGEAEATLPSSVAATAASRPDADYVLQAKDHNHDEFLWGTRTQIRAQPHVRNTSTWLSPSYTWKDLRGF